MVEIQAAITGLKYLRDFTKWVGDMRQDADQLSKSLVDVTRGTARSTAEISKQAREFEAAAAGAAKLTAQQQRLAEAGRFLLQTSAQEERFAANADAIEEQVQATAKLMAAQQRQAEQTERLLEVPMVEAGPEAQRAAAGAIREALGG